MKQIFGLFFLLLFAACGNKTQTTKATLDTISKVGQTVKPSAVVSNSYGFDTTLYEISKEHKPFMVTGYFNADSLLDTAMLIKRKSTGKGMLFIKHGGTNKTFLLKNGKDVGANFDNFNWVGQFEVIKKGTKIWDNVIDGEIVGEDQVPDNKKITLLTDGILIHEDEGGGGGIIYFKNNQYIWVQQD